MPIFLVFFLAFLFQLFTKSGFVYDSTGIVYMQEYKYLINFIEMPIVFAMFVIGVLMVVIAVFMTIHFEKLVVSKQEG